MRQLVIKLLNKRHLFFFSVKWLPLVVDTKRPKILFKKKKSERYLIHGSVFKSRTLWKKKLFLSLTGPPIPERRLLKTQALNEIRLHRVPRAQ